MHNVFIVVRVLFAGRTATNREVLTLAMARFRYRLFANLFMRVDDDDDAVLATAAGRFGPRRPQYASYHIPCRAIIVGRGSSRRTSHAARMITPKDHRRRFIPQLRRVPDVGHRGGVGREAAENRARR